MSASARSTQQQRQMSEGRTAATAQQKRYGERPGRRGIGGKTGAPVLEGEGVADVGLAHELGQLLPAQWRRRAARLNGTLIELKRRSPVTNIRLLLQTAPRVMAESSVGAGNVQRETTAPKQRFTVSRRLRARASAADRRAGSAARGTQPACACAEQEKNKRVAQRCSDGGQRVQRPRVACSQHGHGTTPHHDTDKRSTMLRSAAGSQHTAPRSLARLRRRHLTFSAAMSSVRNSGPTLIHTGSSPTSRERASVTCAASRQRHGPQNERRTGR